MRIGNALNKIVNRINASARKADRKPEEIKLIAVSKTVELDKIVEAVISGVSILGENRVQEAREKISRFKEKINVSTLPERKGRSEVQWHLIGHLQRNKAKLAVQLFDLIHSLDSFELAEILNDHSRQHGKKQRVLIQIKLSEEQTKYGINEKSFYELIKRVSSMEHLVLEGLMTIPPFFDDPENSRPYFSKLRNIRQDLTKRGFSLPELSMGMSNDFEIAIEEGATMIRVGTAIFGERDY